MAGTRGYCIGATPSTAAWKGLGTLTLNSTTTAILAFWGVAAQAAETTVESVNSKMYFQVGQTTYGPFPMNPTQGCGPATNEAPVTFLPSVWPLAVPRSATVGGLGGVQVLPYAIVDQQGTPTNGNSAVGGCLAWEGPLPSADVLGDIRDALRSGTQMPFTNGRVCGTFQAATSATAITTDNGALNDITVLPDADYITGFDIQYSPDAALTAGAEIVGWTDMTSSINGFGKQQYPFTAMSAALGTAVGNLVQFPITSLPAWIPTTQNAGDGRANWTISTNVRVNATIDSSNFENAAYWR